MLQEEEFVKGLMLELKTDLDMKDAAVFQAFAPFLKDKTVLRQTIADGNLRYEYRCFMQEFKGKPYERDLERLVSLFSSVYAESPQESLNVFVAHFDAINAGLNNATQIAMLYNDTPEMPRLDLFSNFAFTQIGNIIEGTYKPYLHFFFDLYNLSTHRSPHQASLGTCVQKLIEWDSAFAKILKDEFYGITVNQWRNISAHHSYRLISSEKIEVAYGNQEVQVVTREQLKNMFFKLDRMHYLLKTAHVLITLDHGYELSKMIADKGKLEVDDDAIRGHIVQLSLSRGYVVTDCRRNHGGWRIVVKEKIPQPYVKSRILDYIMTVLQYAKTDVKMEIKDYFGVTIASYPPCSEC